MSKFYSTEWMIRPVRPRDAFFKLLRVAEELKIDIKVHGVQTNDDGYKLVRFVVATPSRNTLHQMGEHIAAKIGLTAWLEVDEAAFADGEPLTTVTAKDLGDAAEVYGKANTKRKRKLDEKKQA
ncbi:MAG: hypothetical protein U0694_10435 [Anaerolineae bacterium]